MRNASLGDALSFIRSRAFTHIVLPGAMVSALNQANLGRVAPVVDGSFLPDLPSVLIEQGRFAAVDFVGGHCTNDGRTFVGGAPSDFVTDEDIATRVFSRWGNHIASTKCISVGSGAHNDNSRRT